MFPDPSELYYQESAEGSFIHRKLLGNKAKMKERTFANFFVYTTNV